jgi:hypothetical protein
MLDGAFELDLSLNTVVVTNSRANTWVGDRQQRNSSADDLAVVLETLPAIPDGSRLASWHLSCQGGVSSLKDQTGEIHWHFHLCHRVLNSSIKRQAPRLRQTQELVSYNLPLSLLDHAARGRRLI